MTDYTEAILREQGEGPEAREREETWRKAWAEAVLPVPEVGEDASQVPGDGRSARPIPEEGAATRPAPAEEAPVRPAPAEGEIARLIPVKGEPVPEDGRNGRKEQADGTPAAASETAYLAEWAAAGPEMEMALISAGQRRRALVEPEEWNDAAPRDDGVAEWGERSVLPAEWADQALRQSLTELPAPRQESRVVTLHKPEQTGTAGSWDVDGLDRMVRRDARRFDGGFQLL